MFGTKDEMSRYLVLRWRDNSSGICTSVGNFSFAALQFSFEEKSFFFNVK